jgi:lipopolysaccharide heptosyltransferase II
LDQQLSKILIVRTDRIGDVILTLPMAQVIKQFFPSSRVAMLIQRYTSELVEDSHVVDRILYYDDGKHQLPFFHLVSTLRTEKFDVVFHTHPRFRLALMTWIAGIRQRVGTGYRWYSFLFNRKVYEHRKDAKYHELEYNLHLLEAIGISVANGSVSPQLEIKPFAVQKVQAVLDSFGVRKTNQLVILHPGSGNSARDWRKEKFAELASQLRNIPSVKVIITGGKKEHALVDEVTNMAGKDVLKIVDKLNLHEYAALLKRSALFIANSTGPIHIAAAVGTPVIGLYPQVTPLSANRWGPYTDKKTIFTPAGKPADCNKCVKKHYLACECMDSISVEDVYRAAVSYINAE